MLELRFVLFHDAGDEQHHLRFNSGNNIQMVVRISNQLCYRHSNRPTQTAFDLMFAWMRKGYGNPDGITFFSVQRVRPNE